MTRGVDLATQCERVANPISRGLGLMGRKGLPEGGGLVIDPCNGVVSFFMRFTIDVVFLDQSSRVVHLAERLRPWRASKIVSSAKRVIELPEGTISRTSTAIGDLIEIEPIA